MNLSDQYYSSSENRKTMEPIVAVKQGKLRGAIRRNVDGDEYFSFRGIPFAQPPVGDLRFKDPQQPVPWTNVRDTLLESPASAQYDINFDLKEGSDDCLYLDVATTSLTESRPVMVWIHGGAYKQSSNTYKKYGPDYLLKHNIVYVGINYRLGVLGFLNMEIEDCSGNQGIKDQIAALKWIQENINAFGGDRENVTIFGESAGGASVHTLCVSPLAKGLFHKAIAQSGVLSNPWAHVSSNKEYGYILAEKFGKNCNNAEEVVEFLKTIPAEDIAEMFEKLNKEQSSSFLFKFVPMMDNKSLTTVLPAAPEKLVTNGVNVPLIIGYVSHEGLLMFANRSADFVKRHNESLKRIISIALRISDDEKAEHVTKVVKKFYFGDDEIDNDKVNELVQFYGDLFFVNNILQVSELQETKTTPTYLYRFSYSPDFVTLKDRLNIKLEGTCHSDELGCLFHSESRRERLVEGTRDRLCMERMTKMWTDFAKTSNPTPRTSNLVNVTWKPIQQSIQNYLEINDTLIQGINPGKKSWEMWKPLLHYLNQ